MAELQCNACGERFYGSTCPKCEGKGLSGQKLTEANFEKKLKRTAIGMAIVAGCVVGLIAALTTNQPAKRSLAPLTEEQRASIADLQKAGVVRFDDERARAYLDSNAWASMDAQRKETICAGLSLYFDGSYDIYDKQSGKQIAKYSPVSGLKVL